MINITTDEKYATASDDKNMYVNPLSLPFFISRDLGFSIGTSWITM